MTTEKVLFVRMPSDLEPAILRLTKQGHEAYRRTSKLPPGDPTEAQRFDASWGAVERLAVAAIWAGEPYEAAEAGEEPSSILAWRNAGRQVVLLKLPHAAGEAQLPGVAGVGPPPPAPTWQSAPGVRREAAISERFRQLIETSLVAGTGDQSAVIKPSGVSNSILTESLREFVAADVTQRRVDVKVRYLDGSFGPVFPSDR